MNNASRILSVMFVQYDLYPTVILYLSEQEKGDKHMTRAGATAKAKKYTGRLQNSSVVKYGSNYECVHTDYLSEYLEDGWDLVASYVYDESCTVVKV